MAVHSPPVQKRQADKKVVILGDADVGKTCLIHRYLDNHFVEGNTPTIGCAFFLKQWQAMNIAIWDTAGEEKFAGLSNFYCRNANAVILCYDVCMKESYESIESRHMHLLDSVAPGCVLVYVATKMDLINTKRNGIVRKREVSMDEVVQKAIDSAEQRGSFRHPQGLIPVFETSAKTGDCVSDVFEYIFETLVPSSVKSTNELSPSGVISLSKNEVSGTQAKKGCSC